VGRIDPRQIDPAITPGKTFDCGTPVFQPFFRARILICTDNQEAARHIKYPRGYRCSEA